MPSQGRVRHYNYNYDPYETKLDLRVHCSVCDFGGIDPERTQEPDRAPGHLVTTGTTYHPGFNAYDDPPDKQVYTEIPRFSACPFCGSPRWTDGNAPDLKR